MYISAAAPAPTPSTSPDNGGVREFQITTQTPFNEIRVDSFAPSQGSLAPAHAASQASVAAMRPPMPTILSTGSPMTLGRYIVQNTIASGGMGIVYRALDPHLERPVAVKVLKPTQGDQKQVEFFASFVARFRREAVALAKLRHPNIVAVYDYGLDEPTGMAYVVMELVEGESLGAVIERNQKLPYALAMSIIVQMAEALAAAHDLGIVHRDIKPENVILEKGNRVRLIDFGMARMAESTGKSAEHLLGSPNYLSPELAEAKAVDWRSDQFSLATVLLEMLSGRRVFRGDRILQTVNNVSTRATPSFRDLGIQGTPRELEALVMRMHQKFPSRRVQDERELVGDLRAMAAMVS
jgi:serine/threonine-protein kinase